MPWLPDKIRKLQAKPYEARLRLLRIFLIAVAVLLIAFWILTLKFQEGGNGENDSSIGKFMEIFGNFKKLKDIKP